MSTMPPMKWNWDGEVMKPLHPALADKHFVIGQIYVLSETRERSDESHNHYFAALNYVWMNLPNDELEKYPTPEHLRYKALIACGYSVPRQFVFESERNAITFAAHLIDEGDGFDVVTVLDNVVTRVKARSQSYKSMDRKTFQKSKDDVVGWCAALIGMTGDDLARVGAESSKRREK